MKSKISEIKKKNTRGGIKSRLDIGEDSKKIRSWRVGKNEWAEHRGILGQ